MLMIKVPLYLFPHFINRAMNISLEFLGALNEIINGIGLDQGDYVYVSPFEHNAVARTVNRIERKKGIKVKQIPISSENYEVDVEKTKYEFSRNKPKAVWDGGQPRG